MSFETIKKENWLSLLKETKSNKSINGYLITCYIGKGSKLRKVIAYNEKDAINIWNKITKSLPNLNADQRKDFINTAMIKNSKWDKPSKGVQRDYNWGDNWIGSLAKEYSKKVQAQDVVRATITKKLKHIDLLIKHCGNRKNITELVINKCHNELTNIDEHKSPDYLMSFRVTVKEFIKFSKLKDLDNIFDNFVIPSYDAIQKTGAKINIKGRSHIERDSVKILIRLLIKDATKETKDLALLQLWTAARPNEVIGIKATESAVSRPLFKSSKKIAVFSNSNLFKAFCLICDIDFHDEISGYRQKKIGEEFVKLTSSIKSLKNSNGLERYSLRHTALTWLMKSPQISTKDVKDMAGHASFRMLDDHYAKAPVMDMRSWQEARPLNINLIPDGWHGFLVESALSVIYPELSNGDIPNDSKFKSFRNLLKPKSEIKTINI